MKELRVLFDEAPMGILTQTDGGQTQFQYNSSWLDDTTSTPMSLSLPIAEQPYRGARLENFLWGLLPDNDDVIQRWAKNFQVSPRNAFGLLQHVGRDVAGAISFVPMHDDENRWSEGGLENITDQEIGLRLKEIEDDPSAWTSPREEGRFSLAGAQGKFALRWDDRGKQWQIPGGSEPTTHIFKPRMLGMTNQEVNEHLTMRLAEQLGLHTADSAVLEFDGHKAIVVERYDRAFFGGHVRRLHQEDFCQALGIHPFSKYQSDGGPGIHRLIDLVRKEGTNADNDVDTLFRATAFNYAVWGTDAHAKNYSLMLSGTDVVLAPLYDLNSLLPYAKFGMKEKPVKLAMSVGGEFRVDRIMKRNWVNFAAKAGLDPDYVTGTVRDMVAQAPAAFEEVLAAEPLLRETSALPAAFHEKLAKRCAIQQGDDVWPMTRPPAAWQPLGSDVLTQRTPNR